MQKKKLKLRFPRANDPGVMEFIRDFPVHVATLERFLTTLRNGGIPPKTDTEGAVVALVAFAFDEPDKEEAKRIVLQDLTLTEISVAVQAILRDSATEIESIKAQAALNAMGAMGAMNAVSAVSGASAIEVFGA